jgi:hypothetical protein
MAEYDWVLNLGYALLLTSYIIRHKVWFHLVTIAATTVILVWGTLSLDHSALLSFVGWNTTFVLLNIMQIGYHMYKRFKILPSGSSGIPTAAAAPKQELVVNNNHTAPE